MTLKPKNHNKLIVWYSLIGIVLVGSLIGVSFLLFDKIGVIHDGETWNQYWDRIKPLIVASIITYLGWIQLAYRLILDIVLYIKKFKNAKISGPIQLIECGSKYLPKQAKKVSQNALKQEINKYVVEKKFGDNLVKITPKEIVVVYGKEFESEQDFYKSIAYTLGEIQEEIRKKETGI